MSTFDPNAASFQQGTARARVGSLSATITNALSPKYAHSQPLVNDTIYLDHGIRRLDMVPDDRLGLRKLSPRPKSHALPSSGPTFLYEGTDG